MTQAKDGSSRIAVPSMAPGGMDALRSGHFGQCDCYTLVDMDSGKAVSVTVIENPPHEQGGCLATVMMLAKHNINAIIVQGIGMRPLTGFRQQGIEVLLGAGRQVSDVVQAFAVGQLAVVGDEHVCSGH